MKTNFNPSSTCVSAYMSTCNFARNSANNFRRIAVLLVLLLSFAFGARAADYVITYTTGGTTYYVGMDNNNQLVAKTTPDATCVWQGYNNGDYSLSTNTRINIRNKNNTNYYLYYYDGTSIVASTNTQRRWYGGDGSSIYYYNGGTYRYIHNSGSTITTSNSATNAFIPYTVTVTDVVSTSTNPTINGADVLTATGNSKYTATGAAYQAGGYTNYRFNNADHFFSGNTAITPANATLTYAWSLESNSYATVNNSGVVTVGSLPQSDVTLTLTVTATATGGTPAAPAGTTLIGTKEITIQGTTPSAPIINISGNSVTLSTEATGTTSIRYTLDGSDPTATNGTVYIGAIDLSTSTTSPVTIKAVTVRNGNVSAVTTQQVTLTLPEPVIQVNAEAGTATISATAGATIYYTTDGSTPSPTNGTQYNGGTISGLATMTTVNAIAICDGWNSSSVASATVTIPSGVSGGTVTLFDYEDHKWSYYSDEECPIHSLKPSDVKITYYGNGTKTVTNASAAEAVENPTSFSLDATTVKVGPNDDANVFVYYKTLERENVDGTGNVPYTTIPNPFLVRPTGNSSTVTITPTYGTVYLEWSCEQWTYSDWFSQEQAEVTYTYTDPEGKQQSGSGRSNGDATIQVKAGTTITLTAKGARNQNNYRPTITARLNNSSGTQIGSVTASGTTVVSSPPIAVTVSPQTITTSTYRGFYAWRVKRKSSGLNITDVNGNGFANNIIPADTEIRFVTSNEYGNEVEFEALWAQAYVTSGTGNLTSYSNSYERNFHVVTSSTSASSFQKSYPLTVTSRYPDGTNGGGSISGAFTATSDTKFENIAITGATNSTWTANGHDLIVGRGCSGTVNYIRGIEDDITNPSYTIRLESGTYNYLSYLRGYYTSSDGNTGGGSTISGTPNVKSVLGCDYDRATQNNEGLKIVNNVIFGVSNSVNATNEALNIVVRSGNIGSNVQESSTNIADAYQSMYLSVAGTQTKVGKRSLTVEGGILSNIAGGIDLENNSGRGVTSFESLYIRMKGGLVRGAIYGGAAKSPAGGNRRMIFTGGTVYGWVGSGCNGTSDDQGQTYGNSKMYIGGDCHVGQTGTEWSINGVNGGYVFGAGKGYAGGAGTSGEMSHGTTLVVADEAFIKHDVYGGGNYGYTTDSYVHILGGNIGGSVFGGSNQKGGDNTFVTMNDGQVNGGVYGGSNDRGTIEGDVTMQINGGQVGTSSAPANIHGGGYGEDTKVDGNVTLTLGSNTTDPGVTVYGDVYGGSALGTVNSDASDHTYVTMYKGTINGSLYGGGLGNATEEANVNGAVTVTVNGGSVKTTDGTGANGSGGVYGANNINGEPKSSVTVTINATDPAPSNDEYALFAVYGGGNQADYGGKPIVTVKGCDNSIEYVYGGGNAASVQATDVTIWGGNTIGNVFGGGHGYKEQGIGADVTNNVKVDIMGGTINKVFGGSNSMGDIGGTISLNINKDGSCPMNIAEVYGGGNEAAGNAGVITIGCTGGEDEGIGDVYGGANAADINSDITLNITGGSISRVFGGNNASGNINGSVEVNVDWNTTNPCGVNALGYVYGAGNEAAYTGSSVVNILNGTVTNNVYGGGLGATAVVTGDPKVTIGDNVAEHVAIVNGDVYGGGDAAAVVGTPVVIVLNDCNTKIGNVYGGGNAADVSATDVTIDGGVITGMVFGGGHGDKDATPQKVANVTNDVNVRITGGNINKVFGGSNSKGDIGGDIYLTIEKGDASCPMNIAEVYGGGNEAAGNAGIITIGCTGGETEGIGDVYGGANAADINTGITLNITGGNIKRVFGGNNTSGSINGDIQVNVDWTGTCGVNALGNVYGAGNQAAYSGNTEVNILNGTVTGSVYGGGLGATAVVTGATKVNIDGSADGHSVMVTQNVLGGGDAAAVTGSTDVNIINGTISGSVFGGGNAAGVSVNGVVDITGGTIASGVYGGSNASGTVGNTTVTLTNGIIGTDAAHANVHGGGYGNATQVSGNVAVNINGGTIYGDVYGGSALGTVNTDANNTTAVNLTGGLVHGDAYGGGLGDSDTKADVNGNVTVTLNGTAFTLATTKDDEDNTIPTSGRVFGCNNINGSPKGTVLVKVLKTVTLDGANIKQKPAKDSGIYELQAVYGGGNLAAYNPTDPFAEGQFTSYIYGGNTVSHENTDKPVQVVIDGCDLTSIEYVYGGGNAAATPATDVIILGGYEIGNVFGGGNGKDKYKLDGGTSWNKNKGADVGIIDAVAYANNHANGLYGTGKSKASVLGGTVHNLFGASNTKGNVVTESLAYVDDAGVCTLNVGGIYGGGNEAYMDGDSKIVLGCIKALEEIYGGARNADVKGDINLTISSGHFDRVFGGNNIGGTINGSITVTIDETGCNPISIGELYGCGNQAAYTTPEGKDHPTINLISFTSIGNVFGGGLGADAVVTGNPTVNINVEKGDNSESDWAYNGQTITFSDGSKVTLPIHEKGKIGAIGNVFGGGNAAAVIGNTQVNIGTEVSKSADIRGNVYGGGNQANVTGQTNVVIGQ